MRRRTAVVYLLAGPNLWGNVCRELAVPFSEAGPPVYHPLAITFDSPNKAEDTEARKAGRHAGGVRGEAGHGSAAPIAPLHAPASCPLLERERDKSPDGKGRGEGGEYCVGFQPSSILWAWRLNAAIPHAMVDGDDVGRKSTAPWVLAEELSTVTIQDDGRHVLAPCSMPLRQVFAPFECKIVQMRLRRAWLAL